MSLHTTKVKVNNGLTMLFIVINYEQNITFYLQDRTLYVCSHFVKHVGQKKYCFGILFEIKGNNVKVILSSNLSK